MKLSETTRAALIVIGYNVALTVFGGIALVATLAQRGGGS
jgi:hypothetical protein